MPDKVKLTFNGRELEVDAGTPIIALSQEQGQEIPHFCYHPGLGNDGNCRMCLVELEGVPKLVTACTLNAADGMKIVTDSEKVIKARQGVLEFILINHPLDCPICDKGGECPLQEYTRLHGPGHSRFRDGKNLSFKHRVIGEHIIFDNERCIRCSRCIRYQRDVAGREELTFRQRGDHIVIDLFEDRPLTSGFTGNLADICPVGALTTRAFRFKARPWELRQAATSCGGCSLHCSSFAWWKDDEIIRLTADVDHRVNDWWICDRGRFDYPAADTVQDSLLRRQGEQVPVSFVEAESRARELLSESGGRAAILAGSRASNEELAALAALQKTLRAELNCFPATDGELEHLAVLKESGCEIESLEELSGMDRVLVLGEDPELSHPLLALRMGQATDRGGLAVTLVHEGEQASSGDFTRRWRRESTAPETWLAGDGAAALAGDDALLIVYSDDLVQRGVVDAARIMTWVARSGRTRLLHLAAGMNRRGLLEAAMSADGESSLLGALEAGDVDTLLIFGVDPLTDFTAERERWDRAIARAGRLIIQSHGLEAFQASAELVLARRRAVDLSGHLSNSWGLVKAMKSWQPVAGLRRQDTDWLAPLLGEKSAANLTLAGGHDR